MRPTPLALLPALALVAQAPAPAPAPPDLRVQFNSALPGINQMLQEFKAQDAMAKAAALVPAQRPAFNPANLQTIVQSMEQAEGLMSMYRLWASTAVAAGQWEKAQEIQGQRLAAAQAIQADLAKAQQPIQAMWDKAVADGKAYITANQPREADLTTKLKAFQAEFAEVQANLKSHKKSYTKQEIADINARGKVATQEQQEIAQIAATIKLHQDNAAKAAIVTKYINENTAEAAGMVKEATDDLAKVKSNIEAQSKEIATFNAQEAKRKVKVDGNHAWVEAVLRKHENITALPTPMDQVDFVNRLLVLDPGNAEAKRVLANLTAGKEPFAVERKPIRRYHPKKRK